MCALTIRVEPSVGNRTIFEHQRDSRGANDSQLLEGPHVKVEYKFQRCLSRGSLRILIWVWPFLLLSNGPLVKCLVATRVVTMLLSLSRLELSDQDREKKEEKGGPSANDVTW